VRMIAWKLVRCGLYLRGLLRVLRTKIYKIQLHV
jgi:hypothetical protein